MAKGIPTDPLFASQWHLGTGTNAINVQDAWLDYTGQGVIVGAFDDGFDINHADLNANYRTDLDFDFANNDTNATNGVNDEHGTAVLGIIGADDNNQGLVGVAFDADITGYRVDFNNTTNALIADVINYASTRVDILNNSWGYSFSFADNFNNSNYAAIEAALINFVDNGRGDLGGINIFAAGNGRQSGDSANYHNMQNSPYTIAVAAIDEDGTIGTGINGDFSEPGANILVSAPGTFVETTDVTGPNGYNGTDYTSFAGTSAATPVVSGVAALMLEANANLGYRDVQEILALSARQNLPGDSGWFNNGAGLHFNNDFGFGVVDAKAAVRLAETWTLQQTYDNLLTYTQTAVPNQSFRSGVTYFDMTINQDIDIEHVVINLDFFTASGRNFEIKLSSPEGTTIVLFEDWEGFGSLNQDFSFSSVANLGESSLGTWTLSFTDFAFLGGDLDSVLEDWSLTFYGNAQRTDDLYVFTNDYFSSSINDDDGGSDTLNLAAVDGGSTIDLSAITGNTINGQSFNHNTTIENIIGGDGVDNLFGSAADNTLRGGRGDDLLQHTAADSASDFDIYDGDRGFDILRLDFSFAEWVQNLWDDLNGFLGFLGTNADINENDGASYTFTTLDLTASDFEQLDVYLDDTLQTDIPSAPPPANNDPIAQDDIFDGTQDQDITGNVLADNGNDADSDPDSHPLNVLAETDKITAQGGTVTILDNGDFTYSPVTGFFGQDSFTYTLQDGNGGEDSATVTLNVAEVVAPPSPDPIILDEALFNSYMGFFQDEVKDQTISPDGLSVYLEGNTWRKMAFDYDVTADTVLEFDFRSTSEAEVHAIGLDNDVYFSNENTNFQLYGTDNTPQWNHAADNYDGSGNWQSFKINVGDFYTGSIKYLTFVNDDDIAPKDGNSEFANIKIYEDGIVTPPPPPPPPPSPDDFLTFTGDQFNSYMGFFQDEVKDQTISPDGLEVTLTGNTWRKIDFSYTVTENTVLELEFKSTTEAEVHAIGLDNDIYFSNENTNFQLYGTDNTPQWNHVADTYNGSGDWQTFSINVGDFYTGDVSYLTFVNDDDVAPKDGNSTFRNIRIYEAPTTSSLDIANIIDTEEDMLGTLLPEPDSSFDQPIETTDSSEKVALTTNETVLRGEDLLYSHTETLF